MLKISNSHGKSMASGYYWGEECCSSVLRSSILLLERKAA